MIETLAIVGTASLFSWLAGRRSEAKAQKSAVPAEPEPICGCSHHFSMHDADGKCQHGETERILVERGDPQAILVYRGSVSRSKIAYQHERWEVIETQCPCVSYTGPEPLPRYVS